MVSATRWNLNDTSIRSNPGCPTRTGRNFWLTCVLAAVCAAPLSGQFRRPKPANVISDAASFSAESRLVLLPVTVTDRNGKTVTGLRQEHFRISDESAASTIVSFGRTETPVSLGIVFDLSSSMGRKLPVALEVARAVINSLGTGDAGYLITFDKVPQVRVPYTYDVASLGRNLLFSPAHGNTALYDAVKLGLDHGRKGGEARKALIVISDGGDNRSRLMESQLIAAALEADTQIYSIAVHERLRPEDEVPGAAFMDRLAKSTGGLLFDVRQTGEIPAMAERLAQAMREQYLIGFKPPEHGLRNTWRKVRVKVDVPGTSLYVSTKSAYYHQ